EGIPGVKAQRVVTVGDDLVERPLLHPGDAAAVERLGGLRVEFEVLGEVRDGTIEQARLEADDTPVEVRRLEVGGDSDQFVVRGGRLVGLALPGLFGGALLEPAK